MIYRYEERNMVQFLNGTRASYSKKRYGPLLEKITLLSEQLNQKVWNYFEEDENNVYIFYWLQKNQSIEKAIICKEDKSLVFTNYWQVNHSGYFYSHTNNEKIYLHQRVLNYYSREKVIDHIDRNPKNNRRDNLRIVSASQNNLNTGAKNTYFDKKTRKWRGRVVFEGKEYTEYFPTEEEAKQFTIKLKQIFLNQ